MIVPAGSMTVDYDPAGGLTLICHHPRCGDTVVVEFPARDGSAGTEADVAGLIEDALDHWRDHDFSAAPVQA